MDPRGEEIRRIRGKDIALVFQEPMTSLSPVHRIGRQITEGVLIHNPRMEEEQAREIAVSVLLEVGMPKPEDRLDAYTFELSGGMRQRAMIAMALACDPLLLIADEPTTAIDVTIQAQILDLLKRLQTERNMAMMMITHNLGVVAETCDEIAVMYFGRIVEHGSAVEVFDNPQHPYTKALLASIPDLERSLDRLATIRGSVPPPFANPAGCPFAPRCDSVIRGVCERRQPARTQVRPDHYVRCFLYE